MAVLFLLSFGPFNSALAGYYSIWITLALFASACGLLILWGSEMRSGTIREVGKGMAALGAAFLVLILLVACVHGAALLNEPASARLNVAGLNADAWRAENWKFSVLYLFFPILLPLQYLLLRRVEFATAARLLAVVVGVSAAVVLYQGLVDSTFLNRWQPWTQRVGGLASDPNAFALTAFLLIPVFVVALVQEHQVRWRVYLAMVTALMAWGLVLAANRTAAAGLLLLVVLSPAIAAWALKEWSRGARLTLGVTPILLVLAAVVAFATIGDDLALVGSLGKRLAQSWEKFGRGGVTALFFEGEARGALWTMGAALITKAPLAGWGPGGFYREYPNELFLQTGEIKPAFDSVLNHYLMVAGDFGLPTLVVGVAAIVAPIFVGMAALARLNDSRTRLVAATLITTNIVFILMISTVPPAYFPDVVCVWTMQLGLLVAIGERARVGMISPSSVARAQWLAGAASVLLAMMVAIGAFQTAFGTLGYRARQEAGWWPFKYDRNCYGVEQWPEGRVRWCGNDARLTLQVNSKHQGELAVRVRASHPDLASKPLVMWYGGKNGPTQSLALSEQGWKTIVLPLDEEHLLSTSQQGESTAGDVVVLSLKVSRTWVPKKWKVNEDRRELGVAVLLP